MKINYLDQLKLKQALIFELWEDSSLFFMIIQLDCYFKEKSLDIFFIINFDFIIIITIIVFNYFMALLFKQSQNALKAIKMEIMYCYFKGKQEYIKQVIAFMIIIQYFFKESFL